jgi:glycosyltransferase involved in cell wall biosynthesis
MSSLVSVIIPAYNSSRYLGEAIELVLSQPYGHTAGNYILLTT